MSQNSETLQGRIQYDSKSNSLDCIIYCFVLFNFRTRYWWVLSMNRDAIFAVLIAYLIGTLMILIFTFITGGDLS